MTESAIHGSAAVQAIFLFSFWCVRHSKIFLKNKYKKSSSLSFSLLNNSANFERNTLTSMKNFILLPIIIVSLTLQAQYYYKDIISTRETNRLMKTFLANKVLSVTSTGFDGQGQKTNDFSEQQDILQNGELLKTTTRHNLITTIIFAHFNNQAKMITLIDSSSDVKSSTVYSYDESGKMILIKNITSDTSHEIEDTEIHQWFYDVAGQPQKMFDIVNKTDTTEIRFHLDEKENIIDEQSFRKGIPGELIYYYYDDKNRLTDIVRYNERLKKLLPDYMFEYDDDNHVLQKITLLSNLHLGYLIWRYVYNDQGLKTKEALFDRYKQMTGKIEYSYNFAQ